MNVNNFTHRINKTAPRNSFVTDSDYTDGVFLHENASSPSIGSSIRTESDGYESDVDTDMDCDGVDSDTDRDEEERSSEYEPVSLAELHLYRVMTLARPPPTR